MNYLSKVLGINVSYERSDLNHYPNFICTRYCLRIVSLECQRVVFFFKKNQIERFVKIKKQIVLYLPPYNDIGYNRRGDSAEFAHSA